MPPPYSNQPGYRKKESLRTRILRWAGLSSICCAVAVLAFIAGGYLGLVKGVENLTEEASSTASRPTYIYSAPVGETSGSTRAIGTIFGGENRREADLAKMPSSLLDALVAKEDERFREHGGVDLWGIIRALWVDALVVTGIRADETVEGASTITQQYVKNAYLSGDPTLWRKLKEAAIALEIERKHEKDEILGMYLNTVYFGNNAYGVEAAAETYFNKSSEDLTIGDSAALVGLLWSPSMLGTNREEATNQRNIVLYKMRDAGYITRQEHMEALDEKLPKPWPKAPMLDTGLTGPQATKNFAEFVRDELVSRYGANTVLTGGLSVYTTLDLKAQVEAQKTLYGPGGYLSSPDNPDAALVSIEPNTGQIKAMVGNRDQTHFNLVTQARRQAGSSFKPFALIAALEQGIDPSAQFVSEPKDYVIKGEDGQTENWHVENYENEDRGPISLEKALWLSDNSVFTDLVTNANGRGLKNGSEAVADVANRLGVSANLDTTRPSIVLGAQEVSPMDMATAYATIANEGKRVTPTAIEKVVQNEGQEEEKILDTAPQEEGEQVIDPEVAHKVTEIMVGNITQGIAARASLGDRPAAGKSGTTENFFDSWFIGFTPQLVTGVWMGYEEGGKNLEGLLSMGGQQLGPISPPTVIWQNYMQKVLQDKPIKKFESVNVPQSPGPAAVTSLARGTEPVDGEVPQVSATPDYFLNNSFPN
jgi:membrane peptidoglycan carboxypeptidase